MWNFSLVIKTQIQLPDDLYRDLKRLAAAKEWSLSEALRRGAEILLGRYAEKPAAQVAVWTPPTSAEVGWCGVSAEQVRELAAEDEIRPVGTR